METDAEIFFFFFLESNVTACPYIFFCLSLSLSHPHTHHETLLAGKVGHTCDIVSQAAGLQRNQVNAMTPWHLRNW